MKSRKYYHYFAEGQTDEKMLRVLKTDLQLIVPGKIQQFNVIEKRLSRSWLMTLRKGTIAVLVFDTDTGNDSILLENINLLKREHIIANVLCIPQVGNLEDELRRCCSIHQIRELTGSRSNRNFKRDMIKDNNFAQKLRDKNFDFDRFWSMQADGVYKSVKNDADKIKIHKNTRTARNR